MIVFSCVDGFISIPVKCIFNRRSLSTKKTINVSLIAKRRKSVKNKEKGIFVRIAFIFFYRLLGDRIIASSRLSIYKNTLRVINLAKFIL